MAAQGLGATVPQQRPETPDCLFSQWALRCYWDESGALSLQFHLTYPFFGSGQDLSGTARGVSWKLEARGPFHIAMVNVCDASHSSRPSKSSQLLSSPVSPGILVLTPLPSRSEDSGHSVLPFTEGCG